MFGKEGEGKNTESRKTRTQECWEKWVRGCDRKGQEKEKGKDDT